MGPGWDDIYHNSGIITSQPHEEVEKVISLFRHRGVKRVLDVGCGTGRHTVLLAHRGFQVSGFDESPEGVRLASAWLAKNDLDVSLHVQSMFHDFPYQDSSFDAIICIKTLNHGHIEEIRKTIAEMARVLRRRGLVLIVVARGRKLTDSTIHRQKKPPILLDERTLIVTKGLETGVIHYMFNKAILLSEFTAFNILDFYRSGMRDYTLVGERK